MTPDPVRGVFLPWLGSLTSDSFFDIPDWDAGNGHGDLLTGRRISQLDHRAMNHRSFVVGDECVRDLG